MRRWLRGLSAMGTLVLVLVAAGSARPPASRSPLVTLVPGQDAVSGPVCGHAQPADAQPADAQPADAGPGVLPVDCVAVAETAPPPAAVPVTFQTGAVPGCVTGEHRPFVATSTPALTVVFAANAQPAATFEYRALGDPDSTYAEPATAFGATVTMTFEPGELTPGHSYRWRAAGSSETLDASPWCEFTVDETAPDLSRVADGSLDALQELGLRPEKRYPVRLKARQWHHVREALGPDGLDNKPLARVVARSSDGGTVTLTGADWAELTADVAQWADILGENAAEQDPGTAEDGTATWAARPGRPWAATADSLLRRA